MTYPAATANLVILWGRWWDHLSKAGVDATITATPLPAAGQPGSGSPNLVSLVDQAEIKTAVWTTKPLAASGLWALPLLPTNDAQFGAFGGYRIQAGSEPPFIVELLESTPTMTMTADMVAALNAARVASNAAPIGVSVNDVAQAVWVRQAAVLPSPAVAPPPGVLTSEQVVNLVAGVRQLPPGGVPGQVPTPKVGGGYEWQTPPSAEVGGPAFSGDASEITSGVLAEARIPESITRDSELVGAVTAALIEVRGGAPAAFDTLMELVDRLGQDENAISSLLAAVGGKLARTSNLGDLPDPAAARAALGLAAIAASGSASDLTAGVVDDARIPAGIARSAAVTAAVEAHRTANDAHGDRQAAAAALAGHISTSDPHGDRAAAATDATTKANAAQAAAISTAATDATSKANAAQAASQPLDSDLTALAALSPDDDAVVQRKGGAWTARTLTQLRADLGPPNNAVWAESFGWSTAAAPAVNDAAIAAAITEAKTSKRPLWLGAGTFKISVPIDARFAKVNVSGAGIDRTIIEQTVDSAHILLVGGYVQHFRDFRLRHTLDEPSTSTGDGILFHKSSYCSFERIEIVNTRRAMAIPQVDVQEDGGSSGTGNYMFSCTFSDIFINRFTGSALYLRGYGGRSTGSVWSNVYIQNKHWNGTLYTSTENPIDLFNIEESHFRQINIEDGAGQSCYVSHNAGGFVKFDALHFERAPLTGYNPQYLNAYGGAGLIVDGLAIAFSHVLGDGTTGGAYTSPATSGNARVLSVGAAGKAIVRGLSLNNVQAKQRTGARFTLMEAQDSAAGNLMDFHGITTSSSLGPDAFTDSTAAQGVKRMGDLLYGLSLLVPPVVTARAVSASATLALGDAQAAVEYTGSAAATITVPANATVAFPVGTVIEVAQCGTGQVTLAGASGVTLRTAASLTTRAAYSSVSLRKRAADEWLVAGDLT